MNILRRGGMEEKPANDETSAGVPAQQRIEVTVEREWVSMLVRRQPWPSADVPAGEGGKGESSGGEPAVRALPLPSLERNNENPS